MFYIFIVDDDANFRTLIRDMFRFQRDLSRDALHVVTAPSAQSATSHPSWSAADFLIADYDLGRKSVGTGASLIRVLQEENRHLPAILTTSYDFSEFGTVDPSIISILEDESTWFLPKHELGWDSIRSVLLPALKKVGQTRLSSR